MSLLDNGDLASSYYFNRSQDIIQKIFICLTLGLKVMVEINSPTIYLITKHGFRVLMKYGFTVYLTVFK